LCVKESCSQDLVFVWGRFSGDSGDFQGGGGEGALAGEGQKIFMVAIPALHPGKAVVQVATFQVAVNDLLEVRPTEPVRPFEPLLVDLNKGLKMVLHAPVIIRRLRIPATVWETAGSRNGPKRREGGHSLRESEVVFPFP